MYLLVGCVIELYCYICSMWIVDMKSRISKHKRGVRDSKNKIYLSMRLIFSLFFFGYFFLHFYAVDSKWSYHGLPFFISPCASNFLEHMYNCVFVNLLEISLISRSFAYCFLFIFEQIHDDVLVFILLNVIRLICLQWVWKFGDLIRFIQKNSASGDM